MSDAAPTIPAQSSGDHDATPPKKKGFSLDYEEYLPTRREAIFLGVGGVLGGVLGVAGGKRSAGPAAPLVGADRDDAAELDYKQARQLLEEGNARFVAGAPTRPEQSLMRRAVVAEGQNPFAVVLSCADSRVPPEVLFDQGLGDLFVVRSAGEVVDRAVLGSLQYGVDHLATPLLVVLGHSGCGAVGATVDAVKEEAKAARKAAAAGGAEGEADGDAAPSADGEAHPARAGAGAVVVPAGLSASGSAAGGGEEAQEGSAVGDLVAAIKPAVVEAGQIGTKDDDLLEVAIAVNVERVVESLKNDPVIGKAVSRRAVKVVGAVYDLATGEVEWL